MVCMTDNKLIIYVNYIVLCSQFVALFIFLSEYFLLINNPVYYPVKLPYIKNIMLIECVSISICPVSVLNVEIFRQVFHQNLVIAVW